MAVVADVVDDLRAVPVAVVVWSVALVAGFLLLEPVVDAAEFPPIEVYGGGSAVLRALAAEPAVAVLVAASVVLTAFRPSLRWSRLPLAERLLQLPVGTAVVALTWHLTTLEPNFVHGSSFAADRWLLLVLAFGALWHPGLVAAFVAGAQVLTGQLVVPPMRFNWTDTTMLYHVLATVVVWTAARSLPWSRWRLRGRQLVGPPPSALWVAVAAVWSSWYLVSAVGKARFGWPWNNDLSNLVLAAHEQHGWSRWLGDDGVAGLARFVRDWRGPIQWLALLTEAVGVFVLWGRRSPWVIATAVVALHAAIFASAGILFWKWSMVAYALAAAVWWLRRRDLLDDLPGIASVGLVGALSLGLVLTAPRLTELAWLDSAYTYRFAFFATGESGETYEVISDEFAPWDSRFGQSRWFALTEHPRLADVFGSIKQPPVYDELEVVTTEAAVERIVLEDGIVLRDEAEEDELAAFLRDWMAWTDVRSQGEVLPVVSRLRAPHHLWTEQRDDAPVPAYAWQEPITSIEVTFREFHPLGDDLGPYGEVGEPRTVLEVAR